MSTIDQSHLTNITTAQLNQIIKTAAGLALGVPQSAIKALLDQANSGITFVGTGTSDPSGDYDGILNAAHPVGMYIKTGSTVDDALWITVNYGTNWYKFPALPLAVSDITLARGSMIRGSNTGVGEALSTKAAGVIPYGDGNDIVAKTLGTAGAGQAMTLIGLTQDKVVLGDAGGKGSEVDPGSLPVADTGSLFVQTTLLGMLQELRTTFVQKAVTDVTVTNPAGDLALTQMFHTVRGFGSAADDVVTISGLSNAGLAVLVTGAEAITYKDSATLALPNNTDLITATGDIVFVALSGTVPRVMPFMVQAGLPVAMLDAVPDAGSYYTQTTLAAMLQELFSSALGGTDSTTRAYSSGTLQEPPDNATLTAALASLMLLRRDAMSRLMDQTSPPTATAGKGLVVSGCGVSPQGTPDNTVAVASGVIYQQGGRRVTCTATDPLAATTPNGLGGDRYDIVVLPLGGGVPVIREGTVISTDPALTAGDTPIARLTCAAGAFTLAAGQIADLRETSEWVDADAILPGYPADHVLGSTAAPVPAGGTVALTRGAINVLTPAGAGAYNLDNMTGLNNGEWALVSIDNGANPATIRDNATGAGVIWTRRAASIVLADVHDVALVVCDAARYKVFGLVIQAGQATSSSGTETIGRLLPFAAFGSWAADGDVVAGGVVGMTANATLQADTFAVVYDEGTTTYALLSASSGMGGGGIYSSNYQCFPDAEAADDAVYFGATAKFAEIGLDVSATVGVYAGDSCVWEYWNGAAWTAVPAGFSDTTEPSFGSGARPFQQDGALVLPLALMTDWASTTVNGQAGYWVRSRVTSASITTIPIMTARHKKVLGVEPWRPPHAGNLTAVVVSDQAATLHTANDVIFQLVDQSNFESRTFTFAQDRRRERITCTSWPLTTSSRLVPYVLQEDGTNEPTGVFLELEYSLATSNHTHLS